MGVTEKEPNVPIFINTPYIIKDDFIHSIRILSITSTEISFLESDATIIIEKDGKEILNKPIKNYVRNNIINKAFFERDNKFIIQEFNTCSIKIQLNNHKGDSKCSLHYMVL